MRYGIEIGVAMLGFDGRHKGILNDRREKEKRIDAATREMFTEWQQAAAAATAAVVASSGVFLFDRRGGVVCVVLLVLFVCFAKEEKRKYQRVRGQWMTCGRKGRRRDERLNGTRSTRKFASQGFGQSENGWEEVGEVRS